MSHTAKHNLSSVLKLNEFSACGMSNSYDYIMTHYMSPCSEWHFFLSSFFPPPCKQSYAIMLTITQTDLWGKKAPKHSWALRSWWNPCGVYWQNYRYLNGDCPSSPGCFKCHCKCACLEQLCYGITLAVLKLIIFKCTKKISSKDTVLIMVMNAQPFASTCCK